MGRLWQLFGIFLRLGCTSFGGPVAHLGYFNAEFVHRRRWIDEETFAQIVALCALLPGPASSQVGMIVGLVRGGFAGAAVAWLGFTLPSALLMTAFASSIVLLPQTARAPWLHGLLVAAVAVVAVAVSTMYRSLCPDTPRRIAASVTAAIVVTVPPNGFVQLVLIVLGGAFGRFFVPAPIRKASGIPVLGNRTAASLCAIAYVALLATFPLAYPLESEAVRGAGAFFETGALVFGGGHVVLPLIEARVVAPGWIDRSTFLAGYGAAQALPGPLFAFAAYLGSAMHGPFHGIVGAAIALLAIYAPSFLLIGAIVPFWNPIAANASFAAAIGGINAVVVGILLAALYRPLWVSAIATPVDFSILLSAFALLRVLEAPPWLVVGCCAIAAEAVR